MQVSSMRLSLNRRRNAIARAAVFVRTALVRSVVACAVLAVFVLMRSPPIACAQAPGVTPQQDASAREVFLQGKKYYDAGNYGAALENFRQAYEICGRPEMLYNIGQSTDQLGKL